MSLTRRNLFKAAAVIGAGVLDLGQIPNAQATGADIMHGSRTAGKIALTFHGAGAPDFADPLLKLFKATGTHVTIFAVGTWLVARPGIAARILEEGHDLGNHTMTHTQMKTISSKKVDAEISQCAAELQKLIGNNGVWFRPSGTQHSTAVIRAAAVKYGYKQCISYEVDSQDYLNPSKKNVINNVMNNIKSGSIVSMHLGHKVTLDSMPTLLANLKAKGFTPVTLTELLKV